MFMPTNKVGIFVELILMPSRWHDETSCDWALGEADEQVEPPTQDLAVDKKPVSN